MKKIVSILFLLIFSTAISFAQFGDLFDRVTGSDDDGDANFTKSQMTEALTEALKIAANTSAGNASKENGYFKNPLIFIPLPPEAKQAKNYLERAGMSKIVDDAILSINRAAEKAAKDAAPIFIDAITSMTISDALNILQGKDDAATQYLKRKTTYRLTKKFAPVIDKALESTYATQYWTKLTSAYNKVPFQDDVNTDLSEYVTEKALEGLFKLMAKEEAKIRKDPAAWGSNIVNEVFSEFK